jgi:hypothetical protein
MGAVPGVIHTGRFFQEHDNKLFFFANIYPKDFILQDYLSLKLPVNITRELTRLRLSSHSLLIVYSLRHRSCRLMFNFLNKSFLTLTTLVQWIRKCCSSSIWLHWEHNLFSLFIFGLKYLPFSIKRLTRLLNLNNMDDTMNICYYIKDCMNIR